MLWKNATTTDPFQLIENIEAPVACRLEGIQPGPCFFLDRSAPL